MYSNYQGEKVIIIICIVINALFDGCTTHFLNVKYKEYISKNLAHILNNFFIYIFFYFRHCRISETESDKLRFDQNMVETRGVKFHKQENKTTSYLSMVRWRHESGASLTDKPLQVNNFQH